MRVPSPRGLVAAGFAGAFLVVFTVIRPAGHPVALDVDVAAWMAAHRSPLGVDVFTTIAWIGSVAGMVPMALLVSAYLQRRSGWRPVAWLAVTMVGAVVLYIAINELVARPRPPMGIRVYEDVAFSFPSGHSTNAAYWVMLAVLLTADRARRAQRIGYGLGAIAAALVAFSRIYLCAHWTTDVLGGLSLGAFWLCTVLAVRARYPVTPASCETASAAPREIAAPDR